jgi:catalase
VTVGNRSGDLRLRGDGCVWSPEAIAANKAAQSLLGKAGVVKYAGVVDLDKAFTDAATKRFFDRQQSVRNLA